MSDSFIPPKALEKLAKRYGLGEYTRTTELQVTAQFTIQILDDRYVISPVLYNDGLYSIGLSKELCNFGTENTQDEWIDVLRHSEWRLPSGPLLINLMTMLYREREGRYQDTIAEIRELFEADFFGSWLMTGTRIKYPRDGPSKVIHDYGAPDERAREVDLTMSTASALEDAMDALIGIRDSSLLEKVIQWSSRKSPYLTPGGQIYDYVRVMAMGVNHSDLRFKISSRMVATGICRARGVALQKLSGGQP